MGSEYSSEAYQQLRKLMGAGYKGVAVPAPKGVSPVGVSGIPAALLAAGSTKRTSVAMHRRASLSMAPAFAAAAATPTPGAVFGTPTPDGLSPLPSSPPPPPDGPPPPFDADLAALAAAASRPPATPAPLPTSMPAAIPAAASSPLSPGPAPILLHIDFNAAFAELEKNAALAENKEEAMQHAVQLIIEDVGIMPEFKAEFFNQKIDAAMIARALEQSASQKEAIEVFKKLNAQKQYDILHSPDLSFDKKLILYRSALNDAQQKAVDAIAAATPETRAEFFLLKDPDKQFAYLEDIYKTPDGKRLLIATGGACLAALDGKDGGEGILDEVLDSLEDQEKADLLSNAITNHPEIKRLQAEIARLEAEEAKSPSPTVKAPGAPMTRRERITQLNEQLEVRFQEQVKFAKGLAGDEPNLDILEKMSPVARGKLFASYSQEELIAFRDKHRTFGSLRANNWTSFLRTMSAEGVADYLISLAPEGPNDENFNLARNDIRELDDPVHRAHVIGALAKKGHARLAARLVATMKGRRFLPAALSYEDKVELLKNMKPPEAIGPFFAALEKERDFDQTDYRLVLGMTSGAILGSIGMGLIDMSLLYGLGTTAGLLAALATPAGILLAAGALIVGVCALWAAFKHRRNSTLKMLTDTSIDASVRGEAFNGFDAQKMLEYRSAMWRGELNEFINAIPAEQVARYFTTLINASPQNYKILNEDFRRIENTVKRAQVLEELIKKGQERVAGQLYLGSRGYNHAPSLAEQIEIFQNMSPEAAGKLFAQVYQHNNNDVTNLKNNVGMALGGALMISGISLAFTGVGAGLGTSLGIGASIGVGALAINPVGAAIFAVGFLIFALYALSKLFKRDNNTALLCNRDIDIKTRVAMLAALPVVDQVKELSKWSMDTDVAVELFQELSKQDPKKAAELYRATTEKMGGVLNFFSSRLQKMFDGASPAAQAEIVLDLAKNKGVAQGGDLLAGMKNKADLAQVVKKLNKIKNTPNPDNKPEIAQRAAYANALLTQLFTHSLEGVFGSSRRRELLNEMVGKENIRLKADLIAKLPHDRIVDLFDGEIQQRSDILYALANREFKDSTYLTNKGAKVVADIINDHLSASGGKDDLISFAKKCNKDEDIKLLAQVMFNLPGDRRAEYFGYLEKALPSVTVRLQAEMAGGSQLAAAASAVAASTPLPAAASVAAPLPAALAATTSRAVPYVVPEPLPSGSADPDAPAAAQDAVSI